MISGAEIFQRPRDTQPLAFSGERLTSSMAGQVEIEHLHRYFVARAMCAGQDVLDVACGEGYGSALLAQVARDVCGLDYDGATVSHAQAAFGRANLRFAQGDATALPFADASFDAVVSFETIEHFTAHEAFLSEIRRVLRPGGRLIASSPDRDFYSQPGSQPNPFHVRELTRAEFTHLLQRHFAHVATTLQRPMVGSVLAPFEEGGSRVPLVFERRGDDLVRAAQGLPHAMYVVCVASDRAVDLPPSLYIDNSDLDGPAARLAALRQEAATAEASLADAAAREDQVRHALEEARAELIHATEQARAELARAREEHALARAQAANAQAVIVARVTSEHEAGLARLTAEHEAAAARLEQAQAALLARIQADHAAEMSRAATGHAAALAQLEAAMEAERARGAQALEAERAGHAEALEAARLLAAQALRTELMQAADTHAADRAELVRAHEAALASAAYAHAAELARLEQAHEAAAACRAEEEADAARQAREAASLAVASAEWRLAAVENSTFWKATWPLRRLAGRTPRLARFGRRLAQIVWWSLSGQMPQRLRWWRAARAARAAPPPAPPAELLEQAAAAEIDLPKHGEPVVSVIIPSFGQVDYTLRCLASIAQFPPNTPFEVIAAEDASGDPAIAQLRLVRHLRLVEQRKNLGFLRNCNAASARSSAEFLLFLNNDTQVCAGWLDSLVDLLRRRPDAAAAGSKLIFPDGRLQEAGGIIWDDASGWNYGRLDDPAAPVYNYVREADYVSGAALLVRRADFAAIGGFDPAYAPAYCEDSDLAFRLRARGKSVLYQPRSVVVHFEGVTHGTDLASGLKAHQVTNQLKLRERWALELRENHFPNGTHVLRARDRARGRRVVLVVDHYVPQPDRDAGSRTMMAFMRALQQSGRVVKFWTDNGAYSEGYTEALQDAGIEIVYGPARPYFEDWIAGNGADIDGVLLSRPHISQKYILPIRKATKARIAYYGHDLHGARMRRQAAGTGDAALAAAAETTERQERDIWRMVDAVLYPSAEEAREAALLEPSITAHGVVPYAFGRFGEQRQPPAAQRILFVAGFAHPPNEDAACWLVSEILPLVRAERPGAELFIVGSNPTARVRALQGPGVTVAANVSDAELAAFYAGARVAAVPLRYGAGVKLKVVEALAQGLPLVTTQVGAQGCEGLDAVITVASDPAAFARGLCRLLSDDAAWCRLSAAEIAYSRERFSEEALRDTLLRASGL